MSRDISQIIGTMLPTERRAVRVIALIAVCRMFGLFALLPVLAVFAADLEGATPALVGIAVGGYGLTQAALQIPFGALSDRIGRIPVLLFGLGLFAAGSILAANSETINGVIAGRFLQGAGAISATLTALLADATREEVRTRSMAIFGISIGGSFVLALVAGPAIAAAAGVRSLFWMAAALALLAGALLALLPRGIHRPAELPERQFSKALRPDLLRLDLFIFLLHTFSPRVSSPCRSCFATNWGFPSSRTGSTTSAPWRHRSSSLFRSCWPMSTRASQLRSPRRYCSFLRDSLHSRSSLPPR